MSAAALHQLVAPSEELIRKADQHLREAMKVAIDLRHAFAGAGDTATTSDLSSAIQFMEIGAALMDAGLPSTPTRSDCETSVASMTRARLVLWSLREGLMRRGRTSLAARLDAALTDLDVMKTGIEVLSGRLP